MKGLKLNIRLLSIVIIGERDAPPLRVFQPGSFLMKQGSAFRTF